MAEKKTKKELVREFSAGGAVFRKFPIINNQFSIKWLIVSPKGSGRWQLPKGTIEENETSQKAAKREVEEEGGVEVDILEKIGEQRHFFYWEGVRRLKTVSYYLMEWEKDRREGYDQVEIGEVTFLPFKSAFKKLTFKSDQEILEKARVLLNSGIQESLI